MLLYIKVAWREIWGHKLRSTLTLFCVLLGVTSIVLTVGYMQGLLASWKVWLSETGGIEEITLQQKSPPASQSHRANLSPGQTLRDVQALEALSPLVHTLSPVVSLNPEIHRRGLRYRARLEGINPAKATIDQFAAARGRFLTDTDIAARLQSAVIGHNVAQKLFEPDEDPLGQILFIGELPCTVVGVLEHYEHKMGSWNYLRWKNEYVFIPITTALDKITGTESLSSISALVSDAASLDYAVSQIHNTIHHTHRGIDDFEVRTKEEIVQNMSKRERSLVAVGSAVSLLTLIVGGIGIMNLMLASIQERVREIGIRQAIGARHADIFWQFTLESITLCLLGGALGVAAGFGLIALLQQVMTEGSQPLFSLSSALAGFIASVLIGLIAGIYPAAQAARLDPIAALRYE